MRAAAPSAVRPALTAEPIVVVGASAAGLAAVDALRRAGWDGGVTLVGEEPQPPYHRPPLSRQVLGGSWAPERESLRLPEQLDGPGLELRGPGPFGVPRRAAGPPGRRDGQGRQDLPGPPRRHAQPPTRTVPAKGEMLDPGAALRDSAQTSVEFRP